MNTPSVSTPHVTDHYPTRPSGTSRDSVTRSSSERHVGEDDLGRLPRAESDTRDDRPDAGDRRLRMLSGPGPGTAVETRESDISPFGAGGDRHDHCLGARRAGADGRRRSPAPGAIWRSGEERVSSRCGRDWCPLGWRRSRSGLVDGGAGPVADVATRFDEGGDGGVSVEFDVAVVELGDDPGSVEQRHGVGAVGR